MLSSMDRGTLRWTWLCPALAALACGPSYQALYEGDARFEHCYALEETGAATMGQKRDCWHDWTHRYTYGQTRDRVEYAYARYNALSRAPQTPTDEAMMEAAPGEGRSSAIAAPAPTSAFAPPPKVLDDPDAQAQTEELPGYLDAGVGFDFGRDAAVAEPSCAGGCDDALAKCRESEGCGGDGGVPARAGRKIACAACARAYAKCEKKCTAAK
jgi:hypothetical protein